MSQEEGRPEPPPELFGTDGIRAPFGTYPLVEPTVTELGYHLGQTLQRQAATPRVVLGGDTRNSTPVLERWFAEGLAGAGVEVLYVGVVPTPAIAWLVRRVGAAAGVAVSASHNPLPDNGIKLFDARGYKWGPRDESRLEQRLRSDGPTTRLPVGLDVDATLVAEYHAFLVGSVEPSALDGLTVALDCANGATSPFAADVFRAAGAETVVFAASPDGDNINRSCGSTHPGALAERVVEAAADLGVSFDGDGDRALLIDETGTVRDGDAMLYRWAVSLAEHGELQPREIVATTMSNLGLEHALAEHGIVVVRCDVGDRAVVARMQEEGIVLGGEQSGHLVCSRLSTTGDGLLTGLQLAAAIAADGHPLSWQLAGFQRFPQLLRNVRVRKKKAFEKLPGVVDAIRETHRRLGEEGRLVLRYSGTEPLARIMLEGPDEEELGRLASDLAAAIDAAVGEEPQ